MQTNTAPAPPPVLSSPPSTPSTVHHSLRRGTRTQDCRQGVNFGNESAANPFVLSDTYHFCLEPTVHTQSHAHTPLQGTLGDLGQHTVFDKHSLSATQSLPVCSCMTLDKVRKYSVPYCILYSEAGVTLVSDSSIVV